MLDVVNDETADPGRRDKLAIAAAPYCHARVADKGVKAQRAEAARSAGVDSGWDDDLQFSDGRRRQ
jgi:phage terminase small subunit